MLIDKLPIELRELAEQERKRQLRKGLIKGSNGKRTLINSFLWYHSEKGREFWETLNNHKILTYENHNQKKICCRAKWI